MSYSQHDEERFILAAVGDSLGRFLDVGAYDGVHFSNVLALIERGWAGVLVEPGIEAFSALLINHSKNERLSLVHAAVGVKAGLVPFWDTPDAISTTDRKCRDLWANYGPGYRSSFLVSVVTFADIFAALPGPVDFLNIDTEGTSTDLFLDFPLASLRPRAVCVEPFGREEECRAYADSVGYVPVHENGVNIVFARES